jgi:hypothetical protein
MKKKTLTYEEAAKILDIAPDTVYKYTLYKKLVGVDPKKVTRASVETYLQERDEIRRQLSIRAKVKNHNWENHKVSIQVRIYNAIYDHFIETGYLPVFADLEKRVGLARSNYSRYIPQMVDDGELEICGPGKQIFLKGMPELIKKLVEENYVRKNISSDKS